MTDNDLSRHLEQIPTQRIADIVENRLREFLTKRAFRPGDPLPTQTELAEVLGVSRNVVREAIERLRVLGIIEIRKNRMTLTNPIA